MESLIASGIVAGVLDITTTEWADELVGGMLTAGRGAWKLPPFTEFRRLFPQVAWIW